VGCTLSGICQNVISHDMVILYHFW